MSSFEEEAFERARNLSRSRHGGSVPREEKKPEPKPSAPPKPEPPKPEPTAAAAVPPLKKPEPNLIETLFRNKENSLIMMLLFLLMDEQSDPTLIFTLMYLLM